MSVDHEQAEHDLATLRLLISDLMLDWRTRDGRRVLTDNAALIENAMDDLSHLVEIVRETSRSCTVDLRTLEHV
jgi:hypothetical protein